ncbi:MAG: hypothetical protein L3J16_03810 [Anaerolineales bacterium]|nr:hypothetical protein [Anaerolineales bacterium]
MKKSTLMPFLFLFGAIVLVSLACSLASTPTETLPPEAPANAPPLSAPEPTVAPPPAAEPTQPPAPVTQKFFREEFDGGLDSWGYFYIGDNEDGFDVFTKSGRMVFDISEANTFVYELYLNQTYDDVRLETEANNRGFNNNNVSLICRYDENEGWYEFNIANNGLYWIYAYDIRGDTGYNFITNGGSNKIRSGKDTNQYVAVCKGKRLTLYINGEEITSIEDSKFNFREGLVGVSVSSFNVVPINVEIEWLDISTP